MKKSNVTTFKIKPKAGVLVKDPETLTPLKPQGEEKPRNTYWLRRIKEGDCAVITPPKTSPKKEAEQ